MESAFLIMTILIALYSVLALFDGVFLHLYKYKLHENPESKFEHLTHTVRAFLFSGILLTLFINIDTNRFFYLGIFLLGLDVLVLILDAYSEKDSRKFMGGLPRWEYILHLLVNGFHFASIAVFLVLKVNLSGNGMLLVTHFESIKNYHIFKIVAVNLLPGSLLISLLHILVYFPKVNSRFQKLKFSCC